MTALCFIDTETTGLHPEEHEIWEVACIIRQPIPPERRDLLGRDEHDWEETSYVWQLPVDLARADLIALNIGHFHERRWEPNHSQEPGDVWGKTKCLVGPSFMGEWAHEFARLTWGAHMIGMVPSFDENRLDRLIRRHGACPGWHYQPVDVETLAVGSILGSLAMMDGKETVSAATDRGAEVTADLHYPNRIASSRQFFMERVALPWDSERLSSWFGIDASRYDRHTALGDVEWARDLWDAIWEGATS